MATLNVEHHSVIGDGNCMYYAIAHQAGLIAHTERADRNVSDQLRQLALAMMNEHPGVRLEDGLSPRQWL